MNIKNKILTFLSAHEYAITAEIAECYQEYRATSVQREALKLHADGILCRFKHEDHGVYAYYLIEKGAPSCAAPVIYISSLVSEDEAATLAEQAEELQQAGKYQRAATLWLKAFDTSSDENARKSFLKKRQQCLASSRYLRATQKGSEEWFLAGRFAGGAL